MIQSVVYFVEDGDFIKIGRCRKHNYDNGQNMSELQRGNPRELKYLGILNCKSENAAYAQEQILHERYKHLRHRGEWFCKSQELLDYITDVSEV